MEVTYREMEHRDQSQAIKVARSCFPLFFRPFIRKFSYARVAADGDHIIGGAAYACLTYGKYRIGYLEWGFVSAPYRGRHIGRKLYEQAHEAMADRGCESMCALVSDDNTASWRLFERLGYERATLRTVIKQYNVLVAILLYVRTMWAFAFGSSLWVYNERVANTRRLPGLFTAAALNIFLITLYLLLHQRTLETGIHYAGAYLLYTFITAVIPLVIVRSAGRQVVLRMFTGGLLIPAAVTLMGAVMPVYLQHYPAQKSWTYHKEKKNLGLVSSIRWALSLLVGWSSWFLITYGFDQPILTYLLTYSVVFAILNLLFWVLDSFESLRVLKYHRMLFMTLAAVSLGLVVVTFFIS
jgi:ribosomal protein S18 acetylase RimI-like enzyme